MRRIELLQDIQGVAIKNLFQNAVKKLLSTVFDKNFVEFWLHNGPKGLDQVFGLDFWDVELLFVCEESVVLREVNQAESVEAQVT